MRRTAVFVLFGVLIAGVSSARAGLIPSSCETSAQDSANVFVNHASTKARAAFASESDPPLHALNWDYAPKASLPEPAVPGVGTEDDAAPQIQTLPADPSSAALALSGLLSLGAIQLGRNVRKLHLGPLPEWYHAGATQIGHSTPLDIETWGLPVAVLDRPTPHQPRIISFRVDAVVRLPSDVMPYSAAPRGPPLCSSTLV